MLERAIIFATRAHDGQVDKVGLQVILHPLRVMERVRVAATPIFSPGIVLRLMVASVLHDVVEDTSVTLAEIERSFGMPVAQLVDALSRLPPGTLRRETYFEFIRRCAKGPDGAALIKRCDIEDNLARLDGLPEDERAGMTKRYATALTLLP